jgi:hypothetical protein
MREQEKIRERRQTEWGGRKEESERKIDEEQNGRERKEKKER